MCGQLTPPGIRHLQPTVSQLAARLPLDQLRPIARCFRPGIGDFQFHHHPAFTPNEALRTLQHDEILPHAISAHRVFLDETGPHPRSHGFRRLDTARGGKTKKRPGPRLVPSHCHRADTEPVWRGHVLIRDRCQPQALLRGLRLQVLHHGIQRCAILCGGDGSGVAGSSRFVCFRSQLVKGDGPLH